MDNETCYLYDENNPRPAKRRRVERRDGDASLDIRRAGFVKTFEIQEQHLKEVIRHANEENLGEIRDYATRQHGEMRLPVGLVSLGPSASSLFEQLEDMLKSDVGILTVSITAAEAPNIKTILKNFIEKATHEADESDEETEAPDKSRLGSKLLTYDLGKLQEWIRGRDVRRIAVLLPDTEAFDAAMLSSFLLLLGTWLDRLPFVVILGIATSVEHIEDRLPRSVLKVLAGRVFAVADGTSLVEKIFEHSIAADCTKLRLGPALSERIMQRSRDFSQGTSVFVNSLKYSYMCHFHGNPLSIFLCDNVGFQDIDKTHFEAVRNLDSFQCHIEDLLEKKQVHLARNLLASDEVLFSEITKGLETGQAAISWMIGAVRILQALGRHSLPSKDPLTFSALYIKALNEGLVSSPSVRELLLQVKRAPSNVLETVLPIIGDTLMTMPTYEDIQISPDDFLDLQHELDQMLSSLPPSTIRTTDGNNESKGDQATSLPIITAQRAASNTTNKRTQHPTTEQQYSALLLRFHDLLVRYLTAALTLGRPRSKKSISSNQNSKSNRRSSFLFLEEILFYDLRASYLETMHPRPRAALERALSAPHDYLGCKCCTTSTSSTRADLAASGAINSNNPPTAILYQLCQQSGTLINVMDLWTAFHAVVQQSRMSNGKAAQEEDEEAQNILMASFQRGLAELKVLGMIRQTRRGGAAECVAKGLWRGL